MPKYRYTGAEPRVPAPPLQGDLEPGELVESAEPVDHPDLEPADEVEAAPRPRARARSKE